MNHLVELISPSVSFLRSFTMDLALGVVVAFGFISFLIFQFKKGANRKANEELSPESEILVRPLNRSVEELSQWMHQNPSQRVLLSEALQEIQSLRNSSYRMAKVRDGLRLTIRESSEAYNQLQRLRRDLEEATTEDTKIRIASAIEQTEITVSMVQNAEAKISEIDAQLKEARAISENIVARTKDMSAGRQVDSIEAENLRQALMNLRALDQSIAEVEATFKNEPRY